MLDRAWSNLVCWNIPQPMARGWNEMVFKVPSNTTPSIVLLFPTPGSSEAGEKSCSMRQLFWRIRGMFLIKCHQEVLQDFSILRFNSFLSAFYVMFSPACHPIIQSKVRHSTASFLHYFSGCKCMLLHTSSVALKIPPPQY